MKKQIKKRKPKVKNKESFMIIRIPYNEGQLSLDGLQVDFLNLTSDKMKK